MGSIGARNLWPPSSTLEGGAPPDAKHNGREGRRGVAPEDFCTNTSRSDEKKEAPVASPLCMCQTITAEPGPGRRVLPGGLQGCGPRGC